MAHLCIRPACGADCRGCNKAISSEKAIRYAIRYAHLREAPIDAIASGGVFVGRTPENIVVNGEDLDAAVDAALDAAIAKAQP